MSLFEASEAANRRTAQPLAARMRPRSLDEFVGQEHFLGPGKLLRRLLQADRLSSVIFYGPPGSGKTALAHVIANHTECHFRQLNAVAAGVKELLERYPGAVVTTHDRPWPEGARTNYEAKYIAEGRPIVRLEVAFADAAPPHPDGFHELLVAPRSRPVEAEAEEAV